MQFKGITSLAFGLAISGIMAAPAVDPSLEIREEHAKQSEQTADGKQDSQVANACAPGTYPCNDVPNANIWNPNPNNNNNDWDHKDNDWYQKGNNWNTNNNNDWDHKDKDWYQKGNNWNSNNNNNNDWVDKGNVNDDWTRGGSRWNGNNNNIDWNRNPGWNKNNNNFNNNNVGGYRQRCGCTSNGNFQSDIGQDACNDLGRTWPNLQYDWQSSTCLDVHGIGLEQNGWEAACQRVRAGYSDQFSPQAIRGVCTPY